MKKKRFSFYAMHKDFNSGKICSFDVMPWIYDRIYTKSGRLSKSTFYVFDDKFHKLPVNSKERLYKFIDSIFRYSFWAKCEYEFTCVDWPDKKNSISESRPVKIDVYDQLKPNIDSIVELLWNDKFKNL